MYPEHGLVFAEDPDCPAYGCGLTAEDFAAQSEQAQFVGCAAGEVVGGDDESDVVWFDGARCVGECGQSCAQGFGGGVECGDVFGVDAAVGEVVTRGDGGLDVGEDDAGFAAHAVIESSDEVKALTKACCHASVGGQGVGDEEVVPFSAGRCDMG